MLPYFWSIIVTSWKVIKEMRNLIKNAKDYADPQMRRHRMITNHKNTGQGFDYTITM